jgi:hypothetical protein
MSRVYPKESHPKKLEQQIVDLLETFEKFDQARSLIGEGIGEEDFGIMMLDMLIDETASIELITEVYQLYMKQKIENALLGGGI